MLGLSPEGRQKAPSAKRCIKTIDEAADAPELVGQKAPSAKRCIKTNAALQEEVVGRAGQKAPSAKRCIKTRAYTHPTDQQQQSESTERQKVH